MKRSIVKPKHSSNVQRLSSSQASSRSGGRLNPTGSSSSNGSSSSTARNDGGTAMRNPAPNHRSFVASISPTDWDEDFEFKSKTHRKWLNSEHGISEQDFEVLKKNFNVIKAMSENKGREHLVTYKLPNAFVACGSSAYSIESFEIPNLKKAVIKIEWPLEPRDEPFLKKVKTQMVEPESESEPESGDEEDHIHQSRHSEQAQETEIKIEKLTQLYECLVKHIERAKDQNFSMQKSLLALEGKNLEMDDRVDGLQAMLVARQEDVNLTEGSCLIAKHGLSEMGTRLDNVEASIKQIQRAQTSSQSSKSKPTEQASRSGSKPASQALKRSHKPAEQASNSSSKSVEQNSKSCSNPVPLASKSCSKPVEQPSNLRSMQTEETFRSCSNFQLGAGTESLLSLH